MRGVLLSTTIPLEKAVIPIGLKQQLANMGELLFPPEALSSWMTACVECGIPEAEADLLFLEAQQHILLSDRTDDIPAKGLLWSDGIVDICGPPLCGKSFLCHTIAAKFLSAECSCVYFDCEGSISASLLLDFAPLPRRIFFPVDPQHGKFE